MQGSVLAGLRLCRHQRAEWSCRELQVLQLLLTHLCLQCTASWSAPCSSTTAVLLEGPLLLLQEHLLGVHGAFLSSGLSHTPRNNVVVCRGGMRGTSMGWALSPLLACFKLRAGRLHECTAHTLVHPLPSNTGCGLEGATRPARRRLSCPAHLQHPRSVGMVDPARKREVPTLAQRGDAATATEGRCSGKRGSEGSWGGWEGSGGQTAEWISA